MLLNNSIWGFAYIEFEFIDDAEEVIFNINDSELYNRVIKVDIAKPHRGLAGLDSSLPGTFSVYLCYLRISVATRGMDKGECE